MATDFCSQLTQEDETPLYGTAVTMENWILLEYDAPWAAKAVIDNQLPDSVKAWLENALVETNGRVLFIKRSPQHSAARGSAALTLYVATTSPARSAVYRFESDTYDGFTNLSVSDVLDGHHEANRCDEKLVLVCTNGKRDRCCSKFGLPVYEAFSAEPDLSTWQTTHIGGHRYSATAITFPQGIYYGYLSPDGIKAVAEAIRDEQVYLPGYRGRTAYSGVVSAADYFVRNKTGIYADRHMRLISAEQADNWQITFADNAGTKHQIDLAAGKTAPMMASCDKPFKPQPQYEFLAYSTTAA